MSLIKSILGPGIASGVAAAASYTIAGAATKVSEAASTLYGTMGGVGNFTKVASQAKTFAQMNADAILNGTPSGASNVIPTSLLNLAGTTNQSSDASASASAINAATGQTNKRSLHKVTLKENGTANAVVFEVMPEIVEQHTVEYEAIAPPQFPGSFQKYKGNSATQWQVNTTLISRNSTEAAQNLRYLQMLRGWTKPFFGDRTANSFKNKLGAPPPVLTLSGLRDLVGPVPVVITSLNWTWPKDVDYISTGIKGSDGNYIPFPTVIQVPIQLVESYSITQFNDFSLADYRAGNLEIAFNKVDAPQPINTADIKDDGGRLPAEELSYARDGTALA